MAWKFAWVVAILAVLFPTVGCSLGLGGVSVHSFLDQPLRAEIDLLAENPKELSGITVHLAGVNDFQRAGLDFADVLSRIHFAVAHRADGRAFVAVRSTESIKEPAINFLIEIVWPTGRLLREYVILLDMPPSAPRARNGRTSLGQEEAVVRPVRPTERPSQQTGNGKPRSLPDHYGPIKPNETLWRVATNLRPDPALSNQQIMLALIKANPESFDGSKVNQLKAGLVLRVPTLEQMRALSREAAITELRDQYKLWREQKYRIPTQPVTSVQTTHTPQTVHAGEATRANGTASVPAPRQPNGNPREQEVLQGRLVALEEQVAQMQRMLLVKDENLVALQVKLGNSRTQPSPNPNATNPTAHVDDKHAATTTPSPPQGGSKNQPPSTGTVSTSTAPSVVLSSPASSTGSVSTSTAPSIVSRSPASSMGTVSTSTAPSVVLSTPASSTSTVSTSTAPSVVSSSPASSTSTVSTSTAPSVVSSTPASSTGTVSTSTPPSVVSSTPASSTGTAPSVGSSETTPAHAVGTSPLHHMPIQTPSPNKATVPTLQDGTAGSPLDWFLVDPILIGLLVALFGTVTLLVLVIRRRRAATVSLENQIDETGTDIGVALPLMAAQSSQASQPPPAFAPPLAGGTVVFNTQQKPPIERTATETVVFHTAQTPSIARTATDTVVFHTAQTPAIERTATDTVVLHLSEMTPNEHTSTREFALQQQGGASATEEADQTMVFDLGFLEGLDDSEDLTMPVREPAPFSSSPVSPGLSPLAVARSTQTFATPDSSPKRSANLDLGETPWDAVQTHVFSSPPKIPMGHSSSSEQPSLVEPEDVSFDLDLMGGGGLSDLPTLTQPMPSNTVSSNTVSSNTVVYAPDPPSGVPKSVSTKAVHTQDTLTFGLVDMDDPFDLITDQKPPSIAISTASTPIHATESAKGVTEDEIGNTLALAQSYLEWDDQDSARELLREVINEGSPAQRETAQALLAQLGS